MDLIIEFLKNTSINKDVIKLVEGKQPPYRPIYAFNMVELETLKVYIKTYLKTWFIQITNSSTDTPNFFDKNLNKSFYLYTDYQGFNNLIIKNWYLLSLISKILNRLGQAKQFIQLDLISVYYRIRIQESDKWKMVFYTKYGHF